MYLAAIARFLFFDLRQNFSENKSAIGLPQPIILETPVVSIQRARSAISQYLSRRYKNSDRYGHFFLVDQVIKYVWGFPLYAILVNIYACWFCRIILCRHIYPAVS